MSLRPAQANQGESRGAQQSNNSRARGGPGMDEDERDEAVPLSHIAVWVGAAAVIWGAFAGLVWWLLHL